MTNDPLSHGSQVRYRELDAKTMTRVPGTVDPWFLGRYGMNLYRGCEHGCQYCDGRSERYFVAGDFATDILVKRNAVAVLGRELGRIREPGFVFLGGGVCDAYQPAEARYRLARGVLELCVAKHLPVHVLTKSALVERDLDLLEQINQSTRAIVSFSLQTVDDDVRRRFEPRAASIDSRLRLMRRARELGLGVGAMAMPVLPGISDQPGDIAALVDRVHDAGAEFVCFGGLTLRPGIQRDTYLAVIRQHHASLLEGYCRAYRALRASGAPDTRYLRRVDQRFVDALRRRGLPGRPPRRLFRRQMPCYAEVGVLLEHREFALTSPGEDGRGFGSAGHSIQAWARKRIAQLCRRRGFHYSQVEQEFRSIVAQGDLVTLPHVTAAAAEEAKSLLG